MRTLRTNLNFIDCSSQWVKAVWLLVFLSYWLVPITLLNGNVLAQTREVSTGEQLEAERIWNLVVKAKGGQERLSGVDNMLVETTLGVLITRGKKHITRRTSLDVFPNKSWDYSDERPSVFGVTQLMLNYDNMTTYFGVPDVGERRVEQIESRHREWKGRQNGLIMLLLGGKWLKPKLLRSESTKIDSTKVYRIETEFDGRRVDFFIDKRSNLPIRVSFHNFGLDNQSRIMSVSLSDYSETSRIMMPRTSFISGNSVPQNMTFHFNVEYDREIFVKPPTDPTPDSWKRKNQQ